MRARRALPPTPRAPEHRRHRAASGPSRPGRSGGAPGCSRPPRPAAPSSGVGGPDAPGGTAATGRLWALRPGSTAVPPTRAAPTRACRARRSRAVRLRAALRHPIPAAPRCAVAVAPRTGGHYGGAGGVMQHQSHPRRLHLGGPADVERHSGHCGAPGPAAAAGTAPPRHHREDRSPCAARRDPRPHPWCRGAGRGRGAPMGQGTSPQLPPSPSGPRQARGSEAASAPHPSALRPRSPRSVRPPTGPGPLEASNAPQHHGGNISREPLRR